MKVFDPVLFILRKKGTEIFRVAPDDTVSQYAAGFGHAWGNAAADSLSDIYRAFVAIARAMRMPSSAADTMPFA